MQTWGTRARIHAAAKTPMHRRRNSRKPKLGKIGFIGGCPKRRPFIVFLLCPTPQILMPEQTKSGLRSAVEVSKARCLLHLQNVGRGDRAQPYARPDPWNPMQQDALSVLNVSARLYLANAARLQSHAGYRVEFCVLSLNQTGSGSELQFL